MLPGGEFVLTEQRPRSDFRPRWRINSGLSNCSPMMPTPAWGIGRTLTQMHLPAEAEPYLKRAANLEPFSAATHYRLSLAS
jgi:hypothetical protein